MKKEKFLVLTDAEEILHYHKLIDEAYSIIKYFMLKSRGTKYPKDCLIMKWLDKVNKL